MLPESYRACASEVLASTEYYNTYRYGIFQGIGLDDWLMAAARLAAATEASGCSRDFADFSRWLLPLFWFYTKNRADGMSVVDVGCGAGVPLWDAVLNGAPHAHGIELESLRPHLPEATARSSCNLLDLNELRRAISEHLHEGGVRCCTEVLEHLEFNPLPSLLLIAESFRPKYIYFTAPTHGFPGGFLQSWRHYKELPCWRGQATPRSMPHTKPWTYAELEELCSDLGFECEGGWWGLWRVGILGRRQGR